MNKSSILTSAAAGLCLFVGLDLLYTHDQFVMGVILVVIGLANLVRAIPFVLWIDIYTQKLKTLLYTIYMQYTIAYIQKGEMKVIDRKHVQEVKVCVTLTVPAWVIKDLGFHPGDERGGNNRRKSLGGDIKR